MADIFLHVNNAQHGPYTAEQLRAWLRDGTVNPNTMAWREGMSDWQPLSAWGGMVAASVPRPQVQMQQRPQPYAMQQYQYAPTGPDPGFSRLKYFFMSLLANGLIVGVFVGLAFLTAWYVKENASSYQTREPAMVFLGLGELLLFMLIIGVGVWFGVYRLQNIGWPGPLALLLIVPIVNFFMSFLLITLPPGYARTKQLDGWSWFWIIWHVLMVLLVVGAIVWAVTQGASSRGF